MNNFRRPVDYDAPLTEDRPDWAESVKPNYREIRVSYLKICLAGAVILLLFQIALVLTFHYKWLPLEYKTSPLVHNIKYLYAPSTINFSAVLAAFLLNKYYKKSEFVLNAAPVIAMTIICSVAASAHQVYSITLMLVCLPVLMVAVYGNPKLLFFAAGIAALGLVSATICRIYSPFRQDSVDTKLIPEVAGAYSMLLVSTFIGMVMIKLLSVQKARLLNAVREVQRSQHEAQVANQAKTDFLANMSHEIRTPLNAVIGMTDMIMRKTKEEEILEYAVDIQQASNMLLSIINDILDISKIESGKMELHESRYELGSLINDSYNMVAARSKEKGLAMTVTCDPTLPRMLVGDEYHLRQIVVNLLSNAVKYTDEGSVEMSVAGESDGSVLRMEVKVKDTGIGIRKEDLPKLFEKFSRMDLTKNRKVEGTGLGLSITKQLVDLMHGTIEVESVYGVGSVFTVRIPQKIADRTPIGDIYVTYMDMHGAIEEYRQSFEAPEARILVVDDVPVNLQVICRLLEATRMQIDTAASGLECLQKVGENRYDLILMDHMMPGMNGVETLRAMEAMPDSKNEGVPVVMLTANAMLGAREDYLEEGFQDYLAKPVRGARLEAMILKYLPESKLQNVVSQRQPQQSAAAVPPVEKPPVEEPPAAQMSASVPEEEGASMDKIQELLPELDMATGLAYCADDEGFFREMLAEFAAGARGEKLDKAYQTEDWETYQREAHSLKSSAKMVGLIELSNESLMLESAAKAGDIDRIRANHDNVVAHYQGVIQVIINLK